MRYFSTFTGIGGFELGIENALRIINRGKNRKGKADPAPEPESRQGLESEKRQGIPHQSGRHSGNVDGQPDTGSLCVGLSEIDPYACQVLSIHYPTIKNYGDITKIDCKKLPDFDLLVGGFPCQAFSIAGLRRGFDDTRGTLFFELARILREKQPRLFLFENVKGLLSHNGGRTFKTIVATLTELGYDIQWQVLNSKNHGVPQNRERIFIVGNFRGTPRPQVFPITGSSDKGLAEITIGADEASRVYDPAGVSRTIKNGGGQGAKTGLYVVQKSPDWRQSGKLRKFEKHSPTLRVQMGDNHPMITEGMKVRRLTPTECERLQGFPDGWTAGFSDSQRYKMLGNAVTTNVVRDIIIKVLENEN